MHKSIRKIIPLLAIILVSGCGIKISYRLTGASIPAEARTLSIIPFQNRASQVVPGLTQTITDALIDLCRAQTNLSMTASGGDLTFEGEVTDYKSQPMTVGGDERAAVNRFSITVRVKYENSFDPDLSFDQSFTRYEEYSSALNFNDVQASLSEKIIKTLVEDIFNKAFVNW